MTIEIEKSIVADINECYCELGNHQINYDETGIICCKCYNEKVKQIKAEAINQVIELLELCPVCKGTHGKWIKKEDFKQKLGELAK